MKVLITGGAGFIGSHLVEQLLAAGHGLRVLDNLSTGKRENLPPGGAHEFLHGDIRDPATVEAAVRGMDAIVHLAAVASVQASVDDPLGTHASNFDGTLNLLEAARRAGVQRFLYASSAAVYGDNERLPIGEDETPRPLTPYAADKLAGEYYLRFYFSKYGLATTAFRFFNIFGPRQDPSSPYSGVISIFSDCLARGAPVTIFGDGRQTRDFVYVGDLARLLHRALEMPAAAGRVINVGRGRQSSLLELLDALEKITGKALERRHAEARLGDIRHSCADTRRLQQLLGEVPATDLATGLSALLNYSRR
jgi:UDP-glucose 4-epimerase